MTKINKLADKASHIADVYKASLDAAREHGIDQLARYREIGKYIIELNATFKAGRGKAKGNKKLQAFIFDNNLEALWKAKQDRSDAVYIAENWTALKISEKAKAIADAKKAGNVRAKPKNKRIRVTTAQNKKVSAQARKDRAKAKANNEAPALTHVAAS